MQPTIRQWCVKSLRALFTAEQVQISQNVKELPKFIGTSVTSTRSIDCNSAEFIVVFHVVYVVCENVWCVYVCGVCMCVWCVCVCVCGVRVCMCVAC